MAHRTDTGDIFTAPRIAARQGPLTAAHSIVRTCEGRAIQPLMTAR